MDGDQHLDLVAANKVLERLLVFPGIGDGGFSDALWHGTVFPPKHTRIDDYTGDGILTRYFGCRRGTVNAGAGPATGVLFVNASAGGGAFRKVIAPAADPFQIFMDAAPADMQSRFALYAWVRMPENTSLSPLPFDVGWSCLPTPLTDPDPTQIKRIWNNTGHPALGVPDLPSDPAPSVVFEKASGLGKEFTFYLQGIIIDGGSQSPRPA